MPPPPPPLPPAERARGFFVSFPRARIAGDSLNSRVSLSPFPAAGKSRPAGRPALAALPAIPPSRVAVKEVVATKQSIDI